MDLIQCEEMMQNTNTEISGAVEMMVLVERKKIMQNIITKPICAVTSGIV